MFKVMMYQEHKGVDGSKCIFKDCAVLNVVVSSFSYLPITYKAMLLQAVTVNLNSANKFAFRHVYFMSSAHYPSP